MTINELINELNTIPEDRRDERILVFKPGRVSGFMDIESMKLDKDKDYITLHVTEDHLEDA